ncbi:unnamed protein product [Closterium sp. Yama58-4]|nr:unnamed protein product [Closterium sp. Yama58-4]
MVGNKSNYGSLCAFSTVLNSMFSLFLLLINDNGSAYFFQRLESWDLIVAMLFFLMFIVFMVFILLNFLIDAFMSVKDRHIVATSIAADLAHIFKYKWNCWRGRYLPYRVILDRLVELGAKDTRLKAEDPRACRLKSIKRRVGSVFSGRRGPVDNKASPFARSDNHPAFPPAASDSWARRQHVLTVREKRIDAISLTMILQRRQETEAKKTRQSAAATSAKALCFSPSSCENGAMWGSHTWNAEEEEQLEQLSQAVVLQCGEVVKQAALPVKKPVQKLSLTHVQEEVVRCQAGVEELRGMMADMQSDMRAMMALLDRSLPALRAQTPPVPRSVSPLPGQQPLVQPCLKVPQMEVEGGEGLGRETGGMGVGAGAGVEGSGRGGPVRANGNGRASSRLGRRVAFQEEAKEGGEGGASAEDSWEEPLIRNQRDL